MYGQRTVRVILDQNAICIRMALVFLINVSVLLLFTLVSRIELNLLLFITREYSHLLLGGKKLIKLGYEFS